MVAAVSVARLLDDDPEVLAAHIAVAHEDSPQWLDRFAAELDRHRGAAVLQRVLDVWGLNHSDAARVLGVSRQALAKWFVSGVPAERSGAVADLAAATDLLVRYLRRDRIPTVVRRPIAATGGRSLVDVATASTAQALDQCRRMFDFSLVQA